jgi:DNA-binding LytR/AlgR family response regulator
MSQTLQILIVEDEAITAENLKQTLVSLGYEIAGIANNSIDAVDILLNTKVDFAILDIKIQGDKNGIWLANYIRKTSNIPYIFLTAFGDEKTILEATSTRPYGYLLKPFVKQNLLASIEVALINYSEKTNQKPTNNQLLVKEDFVYVKHDEAFVKLMFKDIFFIESDKNYIQIHTENNKLLLRSTLSKIKENLSSNFLQVHRSFIVNTQKIDAIKGLVISLGKFKVTLSNSYKESLFEKLDITKKD